MKNYPRHRAVWFFRRLGLLAFLWLGCALSGQGQDLGPLRRQMSQSLGNSKFAGDLAAVIVLSDELEMGGGEYRIEGPNHTRLSSLSLPFRQVFGDEAQTRFYVEGVAGYAKATEHVDDLYGGGLPGLETGVDSKWTSWSLLAGLGWQLPVFDGFTVTPIYTVGGAKIGNSSHFAGPGEWFTRALFDGIGFNWDGYTVSHGPALRLDWKKTLAERYTLELVGRFDSRWTRTVKTDDAAQEFSRRLDFATVGADLTGPLAVTLYGRKLYWRLQSACRRYTEGDLLGSRTMFVFGGGVEIDVAGLAPRVKRVSVKAAWITGDKIDGYTFGGGVSF